jgi:protein O-mannosyl-transferase
MSSQRIGFERRLNRDVVLYLGTIAGLGALVTVLFWSCLHYFFVTDDFALIEAARAPLSVGFPHHFTPEPGGQYRPLAQYGYFWLVQDFFGLSAFAWHAANMALHIVIAAIAVLLFRQILGAWLPTTGASVYFGIHSSLFLVFAWVAIAGEIWITLFALLSLTLYMRYLHQENIWLLSGASIACILALLSKEMAISVPVILVLAQVIFSPASSRFRGWRTWISLSSIPFIVIFIGYLLLVRRVQGVPEAGPYAPQIESGAIWTYLTYVWWTLDIARLSHFPGGPVLIIVAGAVLALTVWVMLYRERVVMFGLIWFTVGIGPVLFFPDHMFHYYLYWPLGGMALVLGVLTQRLAAVVPSPLVRYAGVVLLLIILVIGNYRGIQYQHEHDQTMMQAEQGERVLTVLKDEIPDSVDVVTIHFVEPSSHVFYLMGYGAAPRLYFPDTHLHVYFDGHIPPPEDPEQPVYQFQWDGHTVVNVTGDQQ